MKGKKKKWWIIVLLAIAVTAAAAGRWIYTTLGGKSPQSLFPPTTVNGNQEQNNQTGEDVGEGGTDPETVLPDIVNIMLIGIDAYENGGTTSGTEPHADVCMVLAIDFKDNDIHLVSLPRDTFTTTPGYYGYYKLNCVFNVGGGLDDPDGGFRQVCRTAEQLMGGVSIPYYYGVDFQAVIDLVDAIGGIDFEVDTPFHSLSRRYYPAGFQHLDGDGVMGYLRIRKESDGLDSTRTERQRKMLVAIFNKLKSEKKITQLLSVVGDVYDDIYTNTSVTQTIALLNYASTVGVENITTQSMTAPISSHYGWVFGFVDQQNRIDLLKEIYGIDAKPYAVCTTDYETWVHKVSFLVLKGLRQSEKVRAYYEEQLADGADFNQSAQDWYDQCVSAYTALQEAYREADARMLEAIADPEVTSDQVNNMLWEYAASLEPLRNDNSRATSGLVGWCGYPGVINWWVDSMSWGWDPDINEVPVDFN